MTQVPVAVLVLLPKSLFVLHPVPHVFRHNAFFRHKLCSRNYGVIAFQSLAQNKASFNKAGRQATCSLGYPLDRLAVIVH
jgi:hypothetical protein